MCLSRLFQTFNVKLLHLHHGLHDSLRFLAVAVLKQFYQDVGHDLPRQPKLVFQPSAFNLLATFGEFLPEVVDFLLRFTMNDERYGLGEFELWPTVQRRKLLTVELKLYGHDGSLRAGSGVTIPYGVQDLRVFENGDIEIRRLLSVVVEPEERSDLLGAW